MGMFDNIRCKKDLPLSEELKTLSVNWPEVQFQTKNLENCLCNYIITQEGNLVEEVVEYEHVYYTEQERKTLNPPPWSFVKNSIEKSRENKIIPFHGKITFYEIFEFSEEQDIWVDFEAYFIYGKLDKINLVKTEKHKSRKIETDKWIEQIKNQQNSFSYKIRKMTGWFWFWKKTSKLAYTVSRMLDWVNIFIVKHLLK